MNNKNIQNFYNQGKEEGRLFSNALGNFERERTEIILKKYIPKNSCTILDVGGGAGAYSFALVEDGHKVYLIDPIELHIEQARKKSHQAKRQLEAAMVGVARKIPYQTDFADIILLMGPLYHLSNLVDRITALNEAYRVLKNGGLIIAAGISRASTVMDCFNSNLIAHYEIKEMLKADITSGMHCSAQNIEYFTDAFFHRPEDLEAELIEAKFSNIEMIAVEGPFWNLPNFESIYSDQKNKEFLFWVLEKIEKQISLLGASAHFLAVGTKIVNS